MMKLIKNTRGGPLVEYSLILGVITVTVIGPVAMLGGTLKENIVAITNTISAVSISGEIPEDEIEISNPSGGETDDGNNGHGNDPDDDDRDDDDRDDDRDDDDRDDDRDDDDRDDDRCPGNSAGKGNGKGKNCK